MTLRFELNVILYFCKPKIIGFFMYVCIIDMGVIFSDGNAINMCSLCFCQSLGAKRIVTTPEVRTCLGRIVGMQAIAEHTAIEMIGTDRPGLLSEISAVLTNLKCNVVAAEVWTHNTRVACVVYVTDENTGGPIEEPQKLNFMKEQLSNVLKARDDRKGVKTDFSVGLTHTERRLHQMMFADRDYEGSSTSYVDRPHISIENCLEKGYSVVTICCKDRSKLLFDTVCTLTDMQYVVFHATIDSDGPNAVQVCN